KPMSTDYQSCLKMIEEIKKSKIIFGMAYNNRFNAGLRYIKEQIEKDQIGNIYYARAMLSTQQNDPEGWRALGDQSKFWAMSATGTHMIDIFRWYFGEPTDSKMISLSPKYRSPNDEISTLTMNFNNKILCDVTASAILPRVNRIEVYSDTDVIIGENVFGIKTDEEIYHNNKKILIEPISSFFGEVLDFTNSIIKNRSPRSTFEDGIKNLMIMQS
ncbi:MAG: Gfo/Idh/MocA family oxidoreductase, partial [Hyphomicrobiales bacterium]